MPYVHEIIATALLACFPTIYDVSHIYSFHPYATPCAVSLPAGTSRGNTFYYSIGSIFCSFLLPNNYEELYLIYYSFSLILYLTMDLRRKDSAQEAKLGNGQIDGLTYRWTDRPSFRNGRRHLVSLVYLLGHLFALKC